MLHEASHNWLNKMMGLKPEEREYWKAGKAAHDIIQKHISGKELDARLAHIEDRFPIVEERDFDPRCKFDFSLDDWANPTGFTPSGEYNIIGFYDGLDPENKRFLEIKTSSSPWSVGKFKNSFQRKTYSLASPEFTESILITCRKDPELWELEKPKRFTVPITDLDRVEALGWIIAGIRIIESGDFTGGLDEDGRCTNPYCYYGCNCQFKL